MIKCHYGSHSVFPLKAQMATTQISTELKWSFSPLLGSPRRGISYMHLPDVELLSPPGKS